MLNVLLLALVALVAVLLVLFVAACLAIRKEDHGARLSSRPSTVGAALTRRIAGLTISRATTPPKPSPDPPLALSGAIRPPEEDHGGR